MKILGNRLLVAPLSLPPPLIALPERFTDANPFAVVRLVGTKAPPELKPGQLVRLNLQMGFQDCVHQGEKCRIHSVLDVQAILESCP